MQEEQTITSAVPIVVITSLEERREKCPWCWEMNHPGVPYPEGWSSTVCPECEAEMSAQIAQAKVRVRAAREARQIAVLDAIVTSPTEQERQEQCIWCWYEQHSQTPYPYHTSSMCKKHSQLQRIVLATSCAQRCQEVAV
jgi:hypothetical protein